MSPNFLPFGGTAFLKQVNTAFLSAPPDTVTLGKCLSWMFDRSSRTRKLHFNGLKSLGVNKSLDLARQINCIDAFSRGFKKM
jgi:hypothetical protein